MPRELPDMIRNDDPDLPGGIKFVRSQRHAVYIDARALKQYLRKLRKRMGWKEMNDQMYDRIKLVAPAAKHRVGAVKLANVAKRKMAHG